MESRKLLSHDFWHICDRKMQYIVANYFNNSLQWLASTRKFTTMIAYNSIYELMTMYQKEKRAIDSDCVSGNKAEASILNTPVRKILL